MLVLLLLPLFWPSALEALPGLTRIRIPSLFGLSSAPQCGQTTFERPFLPRWDRAAANTRPSPCLRLSATLWEGLLLTGRDLSLSLYCHHTVLYRSRLTFPPVSASVSASPHLHQQLLFSFKKKKIPAVRLGLFLSPTMGCLRRGILPGSGGWEVPGRGAASGEALPAGGDPPRGAEAQGLPWGGRCPCQHASSALPLRTKPALALP